MHPANSVANPDIFEIALISGKKLNPNPIYKMWTLNTDIFEFDDVAKSCAVSYRTINQYGGTVGLVSESGYHRMRGDRRILF